MSVGRSRVTGSEVRQKVLDLDEISRRCERQVAASNWRTGVCGIVLDYLSAEYVAARTQAVRSNIPRHSRKDFQRHDVG